MNLITDRTQADVIRAKELNKKVYDAFAAMAAAAVDTDSLIEPMDIIEATLTPEEFSEWKSGLKGAYNYMDLNRVESAVADIANLWIPGLDTKTDWTMQDEITQAEMMRYLSNIQRIRSEAGSSANIPVNMNRFDYVSANNIEQVLLDAYNYKVSHFVHSIAVGDSLWIDVAGVQKEFLVVHQGNPDLSKYDGSCNGTWLLMKDIYAKGKWQNYGSPYSTSVVNDYLQKTFAPLLNKNLPVKEALIPVLDRDLTTTINYPSKVFLLSAVEILTSTDASKNEGAILEYFSDGDPAKRKAYYNGSELKWWTRSKQSGQNVYTANSTAENGTNEFGVRPALILNGETVFSIVNGKKVIK